MSSSGMRPPGYNPADYSPYGYVPSESVAITFIVLFAVSTCQLTYHKMWWLLPTVCLGGVLEILGWAGRLWSHFSPELAPPFEMQICATIIGPTPLLAANFVIFGRIIQTLGTTYSRLTPKWYTIFFCTCDVISLVVQGVGGGLAATAADTGRDPNVGGNIMLGGIVFQLFVITVYALVASEYIVRYSQDLPVDSISQDHKYYSTRGALTPKLKVMIVALIFNTACLFIRAVYRTIELSDGWSGRIITTEVYFNVLDGAMVVLAIYTLNFAHPGWLLDKYMPKPSTKSSDSE